MHRIALRCLFHDRGRLVVAVVGVAVATQLMLLQVGIYYGFVDRTTAPIRWIGGDVWVMSENAVNLDHSPFLPAGPDQALRAHPCVEHVRAAIFAWTTFRRPGGALDNVLIVGSDSGGPHLVPWSMAAGVPDDLRPPGRITIDVLDLDIVRGAQPLGAAVRVGGHTARVGALTRGLRSAFGIHPISFASTATARELLGVGRGQTNYWIADLRSPSCAPAVIAAMERDPALEATTCEDFQRRVERDFAEGSGIAVALGFIALLGFAVAAAVVGQTLVGSLRQHRRELATLKALGATPLELVSFIGWQTTVIGALGTSIGVLLALVLRDALSGQSVPVVLPTSAIVAGTAAIVCLCIGASLTSVREVLRIEADEALR